MGKKAVVIGINAYPPPNALPSCVKDADTFAELLKSSYSFDVINNLRDAQATRAGMLDALRGLVAGATTAEELVFYYSGHGYTFQQGDIQVDSLVGQDCQFLTTEDFAAAVGEVPPGSLTVVLDSCFSGGMQKAFALFAGVKPVKIKFFQPTEPAQQEKAFDPVLPAIRLRKDFGSPVTGSNPSPLAEPSFGIKAFSLVEAAAPSVDRRFILVSACRGDETAAASTDRTNGLSAFTFSFLRQIASDGRQVGVAQLLDEAGQTLRALGVTQTPMLKAPSTPALLVEHAFLLWDDPVPKPQSDTTVALVAPPPAETISKGLIMQTFDTAADVKSIVLATSPVVAASLNGMNGSSTKGFDPDGIDKGWFDDLTRVVATVIPAVVQGMKTMPPPTKGFDTMQQPFDKGWLDNLVSIATTVIPPIVAQLKSVQPGTPGAHPDLVAAAQKGWFDDITHVVANVLPVVLNAVKSMPPQGTNGSATKGFEVLSTNASHPMDEKSFWSTLGHIASVAVPIALSVL